MLWEARMQEIFSLQEIIAVSENKLSANKIKYHCRRDELHPCIYFEGNIVCIEEERFQPSIDPKSPVAHIEHVSWSMQFKGYVHASNFINYIDHPDPRAGDVFFNIDKIVEFLTQPTTYAPLLPLSSDQYLRAFPRMMDDDIQEKKWLNESFSFEGNPFLANDIVFTLKELKTVFPTIFKCNEDSQLELTQTDEINDLTKQLHQAQERIKELEQINISESEFKKISTANSRLLTLIGAMLCESNKRGLRSINQAGIVSEIANMQIPNLSKRVIDEFFSEANKKFKPYKTIS